MVMRSSAQGGQSAVLRERCTGTDGSYACVERGITHRPAESPCCTPDTNGTLSTILKNISER